MSNACGFGMVIPVPIIADRYLLSNPVECHTLTLNIHTPSRLAKVV